MTLYRLKSIFSLFSLCGYQNDWNALDMHYLCLDILIKHLDKNKKLKMSSSDNQSAVERGISISKNFDSGTTTSFLFYV